MISIAAGMGDGKTYAIMAFVEHAVREGKTVVFATQRRIMILSTLGKELRKRGIPFTDYRDINGAINVADHQVLLIEYESLHRLLAGTYHCVIYDEFRSIINTMNSSTNGVFKIDNYERFADLVVTADKNVFTDADITTDGACCQIEDRLAERRAKVRTDEYMRLARATRDAGGDPTDLLAQALNSVPEPVMRFDPQIRRMCRTANFVTVEQAVWRARADLHKGRCIMIACGSRERATVLEQLLIPHLTTGSMGLYTSETDNTADLINIDDVWDGHQCIIFTTVITTGIDYNTLIHRIFIFPCANTATACDAFQQGGRGRNVLTNEIWIAVKEGAYQEALQKPLTRCEIDKTAQEEMDRIAAGGVIMAP
ncbi:replication origin-binding protein [Tribonema minus]|uniref:Replication origin-binding protein n=1 Tax=Tribonema minus TaxID=303371 RepID=A0A835Z2T1_9STRA|nr:replication origin-binding protein [Tribonema minus]